MTNNSPSLWSTTAEERAESRKIDDGAVFDIVAVGGGFTGLSTALHAREIGLSACVIEAEQIGHGGSGRNVGLVNAGVWLPPQDVGSVLGEADGARLVDVLGKMPGYVFDLIEKYQIQCEANRNGSIHVAHSARGLKELKHRADGWARIKAPVDLLTAEQVAEKTGTTRFHGGLLDRRAGTINPMGYVRGLARVAAANGAHIVSGTKVVDLVREAGRWRVVTEQGDVFAKTVVLGTNAYTDDLWPGLKSTFTTIEYFQVATVPLGSDIDGILEGVRGIWDTAPVMTSLRRDGFGRLIVGSMGRASGGMTNLSRRWAQKRIGKLFPQLKAVEFEAAWHGQIAMTPDHILRIHRLDDNLFAPIGYNGRGITTGTMFGKALAEIAAGADDSVLPVPVSDVTAVSGIALKKGFFRTAFAAHKLWRSFG